ncbi:MAG: histone H1 [Rhodobacteraceae bacterium]|nr:histone H1 [Paracoccaceae bacterium]
MSDELATKWSELKTLVESLELDVLKQASGNASAGVRARRGLRLLKNEVSDLVRTSLEVQKGRQN